MLSKLIKLIGSDPQADMDSQIQYFTSKISIMCQFKAPLLGAVIKINLN